MLVCNLHVRARVELWPDKLQPRDAKKFKSDTIRHGKLNFFATVSLALETLSALCVEKSLISVKIHVHFISALNNIRLTLL
jgi:hypothetical protein